MSKNPCHSKFRLNTSGWSKLIVCLLLLLYAQIGISQSKSSLEKKRKELTTEIKSNNQLLTTTRSTKKATLSDLAVIKRQIKQRQELLKIIGQEIELIDVELNELQSSAEQVKIDLVRLEGDYKQMMRHAYRRKNRQQRLMFLLSSEDFNSAAKRWQYLKRYDLKRREQLGKIVASQTQLKVQLDTLQGSKTKKETLLVDTESQKNQLQSELKEKDRVLKDLERQESKLQAILNSQKKSRNELTNKIDQLIRTEMEASRRRSRQPAKGKTKVVTKPLNDEELRIANNFAKNKGKLPMPATGVITEHFGRQPHPIIKGVFITNNGINIKTKRNTPAKAVYDGVVSSTFFVPGNQQAVMLKHGNYYTVYANLETVSVKKGQKIKQGQAVGRIGQNRQNKQVEVHFEIWKNDKRQNPETWLKN